MTQKRIRIDDIRIDGSTQMRESIDADDVKELAEHYAAGKETPPPVVFFDGTAYWPGDGHHRIAGHRAAGRDSIIVEVEPGTKRDAILFAAGANSEHGVKRTNGDKRKAVATLLKDQEWGAWSDRAIADKCRVGHPLVASVRAQLSPVSTGRNSSALENQPNNQDKRIAADGRTMPASQPARESAPLPRCDRCTRLYRGTDKSERDCPQCETLRSKQTTTKSRPSNAKQTERPAQVSDAAPEISAAATKVCPNCKGTGRIPEKAKAVFTPPTLDEVRSYCEERKNGIDPEAFIAHYTTVGWVYGEGKGKAVKDWKACVITWEKSKNGGHKNGKPAPNAEREHAILMGWYKPSSGEPFDPKKHCEKL